MNSYISLILAIVLVELINISTGGTPCMTWIHRATDQVSLCTTIQYYSSGDLIDVTGKQYSMAKIVRITNRLANTQNMLINPQMENLVLKVVRDSKGQ